MRTRLKKVISVILAVVMLFVILTVAPLTVSAVDLSKSGAVSANEYTSNGYKYTVYNSEATITGYTGGSTTLNIPSYLGGYKVKSIGQSAFYNDSKIITLTIPNSVTEIGNNAFKNCVKLTTVSIGNSVDSMGYDVFSGCTSLTKVVIANGTTIIGSYAFDGCTSLKSVTIPNTVTKIKNSAFNNCKSLTNISIPNSVKEIWGSAFSNCTNLSTLSLGNGVTSIGDGAFYNDSKIITLTIPNSVTEIGNNAFKNCVKLTTVSIGNSVDSMGYDVFSGCTSLTKVVIANGTTIIGSYAFDGCTSLTDIAIPDPFIRIGYVQINDDNLKDSNVFRNCPSKLTIHGKSGSFAQQFAKANGIKFSTSPVSLTVSPTSVSLNKTSLTLEVGKTYTLTKTISPSTATTSYSWSSSNTSVATVNSSGKVTAKKTGTATITVKTSNGKTATCKVTVIKTLPTPKISKLENKAGGIKLSWNKVDGAYGYRLYYKTSSGSWKQFKETTSTSFTDSSVSPGKTETYTIGCIDKNSKLVSKYDSTGWSKKYTPVAPTISKLDITTGGIKLSWNKIAGVYGYRLYYKTSSGGWKRFKDTTATSFTDSGVSPNRTETYTIRCIDRNGNTVSGFNSNGWSIKYTPVAPTISKLENTSGGIKLTWNKIAGVYGYRLYYRPASGGWKRFKDTTATTYTDAAVKSGRTETYTIRCIDKNGNTVSGYNSKGWSKKYVYNPPKSIKLNKTSAYIGKKESVTLKYTLSAGSTSTVTWSSSNKNVATVSGGKVTAKGAGATTITATTANGKKATCKVTVINGVRQYYTCTSGNRTIAEYSVVVPDGCYDKQSNAWRCYYEKYNYDKYDMGYVGAILFTKSPYSQSSPPAPNFTKLGEKNGYVFGYTTATGLEFIADDITSVEKYSTAHQTFNYAVKTFRFE